MADYDFEIEGAAEPAEVKSYVEKISKIGSRWHDFAMSTLEQFCEINTKERSRALCDKGQFFDPGHGNIFVLGVIAALTHAPESHKKCLFQLMSMDPISTCYIYLDPHREDKELNSCLRSCFSKIEYCDHDTSIRKYKSLFEQACSHASADQHMNALLDLKKFSTFSDPSIGAIYKTLYNRFTSTYEQIASSNDSKYYSCLSSSLRKRMRNYDEARYVVACQFGESFAASPREAAIRFSNPERFKNGATELHHQLMNALDDKIRSQFSEPMTGVDQVALMKLMHFVRSDFFVFIPMGPSAVSSYSCEPYDPNTSFDSYKQTMLDQKKIAPICLTLLFNKHFDVLF